MVLPWYMMGTDPTRNAVKESVCRSGDCRRLIHDLGASLLSHGFKESLFRS